MKDRSGSNKPNKYKRLITDTFVFALGNLGSKVILFFMVPLYTNFLSKEEYGTSDLVFTIAQLLIPFVSLVIFDAVLRFGISKDANKNNVLKSSFLVLGIGSIVTVFITPLFGFYAPLAEWKWYLCVYVILTMIGNVELNYLKLIERNKTYAIISILHTLALALTNVLLLTHFHWGIRGYLVATIIGSLTTVLIGFFAGNVWSALRNGSLDRKLLSEMIKFSAPLILNNVSWWVIQSSDKIMIEAMVGAAALGLYTAATKIPSLINVVISIFSQAWGISSVREFESSNDKGFYTQVFTAYSVIGFGAAVCINTIVKPFMTIYVSQDFFESWRFVPLLLASASFSAVASYYGSLYGALKKSVNNMRSTLIAAIVNIIVNYLCILWFGAWGAIIGTVSAYLLLALYRMIDVLRYIKFDPHWKEFILNVLIVLIQAILVSMDFHNWVVSIAAIILFVIINRSTIQKIAQASLNIFRRKL